MKSGSPASESTLITAVAATGGMRHSRSRMPKIAKEKPAATNMKSPVNPCVPKVLSASVPMTIRPTTMTSAPPIRRAGRGSLSTRAANSRPPSEAHDGWMIAPWPSGTRRKPA